MFPLKSCQTPLFQFPYFPFSLTLFHVINQALPTSVSEKIVYIIILQQFVTYLLRISGYDFLNLLLYVYYQLFHILIHTAENTIQKLFSSMFPLWNCSLRPTTGILRALKEFCSGSEDRGMINNSLINFIISITLVALINCIP